jgi:hypothetical protein
VAALSESVGRLVVAVESYMRNSSEFGRAKSFRNVVTISVRYSMIFTCHLRKVLKLCLQK